MWKTERKVRAYVDKQQMILPGDRLILGVSGGADSVYLFHLLVRWQKSDGFSLEVVHVNHGLRGVEADRDELFVKELCKKYQVPFHGVHRDVDRMAKTQGISTEEAGRMVRYEAFEKFCGGDIPGKIVLAHHQDDLAETMVHHLARGTGLQGLCSLKPVSGNRIRPLLCLTRWEIEQELRDQAYEWQTDSTNLEDGYTRNKIRHHVIDYMKREINPQAVSHMAETAMELEEIEELLEESTRELAARWVCRKKDRIDFMNGLCEEPALLQRRLLLQEMKGLAQSAKDFTRTHAQDVQGLWKRQVGKRITLPHGLCAVRTYEGIRLQINEENWTAEEKRPKSDERCISIVPPMIVNFGEFTLSCALLRDKMDFIQEKKYTKWLDYDKMNPCLQLRHRRPGDRICVNGQGGSRKLKDYLIDKKIPKEERDSLWLLADGSNILWVIGYRIGESCKVTEETKTILNIQIRGGNIHE